MALHAAITKQETGVARPFTDADQTLAELFTYWINEYPPKKKLGKKR